MILVLFTPYLGRTRGGMVELVDLIAIVKVTITIAPSPLQPQTQN